MTINIGDVNVSVPNGISDWVHQNDDNKTEFDGMIESIMYAVNYLLPKGSRLRVSSTQVGSLSYE